jgi:hypothetical protein
MGEMEEDQAFQRLFAERLQKLDKSAKSIDALSRVAAQTPVVRQRELVVELIAKVATQVREQTAQLALSLTHSCHAAHHFDVSTGTQLDNPERRLVYVYLMDSIIKNSSKHSETASLHYNELFRAHAGDIVVQTYFMPTCPDTIK